MHVVSLFWSDALDDKEKEARMHDATLHLMRLIWEGLELELPLNSMADLHVAERAGDLGPGASRPPTQMPPRPRESSVTDSSEDDEPSTLVAALVLFETLVRHTKPEDHAVGLLVHNGLLETIMSQMASAMHHQRGWVGEGGGGSAGEQNVNLPNF